MRQVFVYIINFILLFQIILFADEFNKVGTTVARFLKIESGARPVAMGGAYAALANDATALYWNVAGIAQLNSIQGNFSYTNWIADLTHNFAGMVIPMGRLGNVGFSVITLNSDEIEQTTIDQPRGTGVFVDASDIAIGVSYARFMTDYVSVGITGKYIQQNLWELSAKTVALDIGFLLHTDFKGLKLGMTLRNIGPEMHLGGRNLIRGFDKWSQSASDPSVQVSLNTASWPLPTSYRVSIAVDVLNTSSAIISGSGPNHLTLAFDALHPNDNPEHYSVGLEYAYNQRIFGRGGYKGRTDEQGFTVGGGLKTPIGKNTRIIFDYAYADFGIFDYIQQFSLSFVF